MTGRYGGAGFFGKVPSHGDFVSRRLPADFLSPWDGWLQAGLACSRQQLGAGWLDAYLNAPIWRFALDAGLCGPSAWAGLIMPGVDRVGRYFPLTLAHVIADDDGRRRPPADEVWYAQLETLALSTLEPGFSLGRFDAALAALAPPRCEAAAPDGGALFRTRCAGRPAPLYIAGIGLPGPTDFGDLLAVPWRPTD